MKKKNKFSSALIGLLAGIGISSVAKKALDNHGTDLKDVAEKAKQTSLGKVTVTNYQLHNAYHKLNHSQKGYVDDTIRYLIPKQTKLSNYMFQKHAIQYLKTLEHLSHRNEANVDDVRILLTTTPSRAKQLIIGLSRQGVLSHEITRQDTVLKDRADFAIKYIKPFISKSGIVIPSAFLANLRNVVAYTAYDM